MKCSANNDGIYIERVLDAYFVGFNFTLSEFTFHGDGVGMLGMQLTY